VFVRLKKQAEAEDLTQEVFIKALRSIDSYKIGKTHLQLAFPHCSQSGDRSRRKFAKRQETSLDDAHHLSELRTRWL